MQNKSKAEVATTVYHQNGTSSIADHFLPEEYETFFIQIYENESGKIIFYPRDQLIRQLDTELAMLGDSFRRLLFPNDEAYYQIYRYLPAFISTAGLSSDSSLSKDGYEKILSNRSFHQKLKPFLYLADVQYLISSVQNLLIGMNSNFVDFYRILTEIQIPNLSELENTTYVVRGEEAERIISLLGSYYVKLYSIMDLAAKITYEFENPCTQFESSIRLKSANILYNNKNRLQLNEHPSTIFIKDTFITEIETLRNEIVHNGTWEDGAKVYVDVIDKKAISRFVLYPDMENGRFVSFGNRHHFFSKGLKVNELLPHVHHTFLSRLLHTVFCIRDIVSTANEE